jgi:hypothetical protein
MDDVVALDLPSNLPLLILWLGIDVGHGRWPSGRKSTWQP